MSYESKTKMSLTSKAKTTEEVTQSYDLVPITQKWVPLEDAQTLEEACKENKRIYNEGVNALFDAQLEIATLKEKAQKTLKENDTVFRLEKEAIFQRQVRAERYCDIFNAKIAEALKILDTIDSPLTLNFFNIERLREALKTEASR